MATAFVALGSNVGDRRSHLDHARERLHAFATVVAGSPIYETDPIGGPEGQGPYLNAVIGIDTALTAPDLLEALLGIDEPYPEDDEDEFVTSEEVKFEQSIPFPTDI
jgi:2-amino-4-hydroxy-6-hydroxymethyldihydropteridine diphosphokinase